MSIQLDSESCLRKFSDKEKFQIEKMIQGAMQNDMVKIHLALGGMFACQELGRDFKAHVEGVERLAAMREEQQRTRRLRDHRRQLSKEGEQAA